METIRLTQTVQKGGCAAKVAASELRKILANVEFPPRRAELMVDGDTFDDAAIYRISKDLAMVKTIDFFTPILDTPSLFGEVAAVNAISDVYAMGGKPALALAVLAFPLATLPSEVAQEVLQGACRALTRAQASLAGGHSIDDDTLKFGLSVTGFVHPERIWTNSGAQAGDILILTKGIGTGTLTAGLKRGAWAENEISQAIQSMCTLNNAIDLLPESLLPSIHGATDITGFGLSGHSMQMAKASNAAFDIEFSAVSVLEGARQALAKEFLTKAHRTNREYTKNDLISDGLSLIDQQLIHDPQTSGGLLLAVDPAKADAVLAKLKTSFELAKSIGRVLSKEPEKPYVTIR